MQYLQRMIDSTTIIEASSCRKRICPNLAVPQEKIIIIVTRFQQGEVHLDDTKKAKLNLQLILLN